MSTLVILLPARPRSGTDAPQAVAEFTHVRSADGRVPQALGRSTAAAMPAAQSVVAVVPATEIAWHRVTLPRAPAARLRTALGGLLEEQLLEDDAQVHLAVEPGAKAGEPAWIAAVHRPWLAAQLAALEQAGLSVERVVPALWPDATPRGHFFVGRGDDAEGAATWLALADADGLTCLRLDGSLARLRQPAWSARPTQWSAQPGAAAAAQQWLGAAVPVASDAETVLAATHSPWNLRQFDLAPHHRGTRALREAGRRLLSPAWRPVRWGVAALALVHLLGLNLWAWRQQQATDARRQAMAELLRSTHPQVRAVLDAPVQMQRETELLRSAAGRVGETDLEPMLATAARAWPDGTPPVQNLRFEPGRLSLGAAGWTPQQWQQFRGRAEPAGWTVEQAGDRATLARPAAGRTGVPR